MRNKSLIFLFALIFMIVFSLGAVSADDLQGTDSGTVSGDLDVATANPMATSGELTYDVPAEAKEIKSADLYVNVYSGSAQNTYGANANVSINTSSGEKQIASEQLWIEEGSADGTVYTVNDHINKCYSDYQMYYDLTDTFKGLNGSSVAIKVDTFKMEGKEFDGRIKLIALILAYDDGDNDTVNYWVDSNQKWTKTNITTTFATEAAYDIKNADLINIALSTADGNFSLNGESLGVADNHTSGNYYQYNYWNVTDKIKEGKNTELLSINAGTSIYGSLKNVLTVLKLQSNIINADVSLATEYADTCFAGTNNVITVNVKANTKGNYTVELLADGEVVNSTVVALDGENESVLLLTDSAVRSIDETTVNGANNTMVNYGVNVKADVGIVGSASKTVPVLYNGNLGYDMEYDVAGFEPWNIQNMIAGDVVVDIQDVSTYLGASAMNRTDVWTVSLGEDSEIIDAFLLIPYNWFNPNLGNETESMFDLTFNGNEIVPVAHYRDQGNMGKYGAYGYGVLIYSVDNTINGSGINTLVLNKKYATPAVYPSALVYSYEAPGESIKEISFMIGADLLSNASNKAGRIAKSDSVIEMENSDFVNATIYILAASAQKGESNIIVNGKAFEDVWNGSSFTTDLFTADITDVIDDSNNISFVATGSTILALPQIIVADTGMVISIDSIQTEYKNTCFAGTNNTVTVTVSNSKSGEFEIYLLANMNPVDELKVNLTNGTNTLLLADPTIRPIDETTVNGAENNNVTYNVIIFYNGYYVYDFVTVPVLYNGYLGKDMEYNATYIEDITAIQVTGEFSFNVKDASTYLDAQSTNRTDAWTVVIDENSTFECAFVYLAYNWDKSGIGLPIFNITFNGQDITPKAHYRDQSNLGTYGTYGYGLLVYDVADLIKNGENTLVINKPIGLTAFYPSNLIYFTNSNSSGYVTTVYMGNGVDLLYNSYNKAGRPVKTDSYFVINPDNLIDASFIAFAATAQKGEGDLIINGDENVDVWNGTANGLEYFEIFLDNVTNLNNISFVSTGGTILALNQMIVTYKKIATAEVSFATEYKDTCYAGTENAITITAKADKAANYTVYLLADDVIVDTADVALDGENETTLILVDPTIRPIDETTVSGANNTKVNYTVIVCYGDYMAGNESKVVPVLYDGYLGKDMEYNATFIEDINVIQFTGTIEIKVQDVSTYAAGGITNRTDVWAVEWSENETLVKSFVYLAYNWDKSGANGPVFNITFNGQNITPKAHYRDQSNLGTSGTYGYGLFVYDVTDLIENGNNTLVLNKPSGLTAFYPSNLLCFYNDTSSKSLYTAYIGDGADLLAGTSYNKAERTVKTDSQFAVDVEDVLASFLAVFAASAQSGEGNLIVNDEEAVDIWSGTSNSFDYIAAALDEVCDVNNISFVATGSTILALSQIFITEKEIVTADVSLATEYKDTCYAGAGNLITIDVKADKPGNYTVVLLADDVVVDSDIMVLDGENKTSITLLDLTTRPVDETTVIGANNTKVNYTVDVLFNGKVVGEASKVVPVLYDGYLGKDMEYNATYIENITVIKFNAAFVDYKNDTTYLTSGDTNRTDVWNISLEDNSSFVKAFVYLAYNWDKSGANGPEFNATFNGQSIVPKAHYRDQSNLGTYGTYGYGLLVFDVTDLAQNGNNTLVINKPSGLTAFYPSNLIGFYNITGCKLVLTAYLADGADLLSYSSYNKAERLVFTDSLIAADTRDVGLADLVVFAASAQKGEGSLLINGIGCSDVWNGTSNSLEAYLFNLTNDIKDVNEVTFTATGSTILALNQMIIVTPNRVDTEIIGLVVDGNATVGATLVDANGIPIANEKITYKVNGVENTTTTNEKGEFAVQATSNSVVEIIYGGNGLALPTNTTIALKDLAPVRKTTSIRAQDYTTYAIEFYEGERGNYFEVQLVDQDGNALANKSVKIGFNGVSYDTTTNATGWAKLQINLMYAGTYTFAVAFLGDDDYTGSFVVQKIIVNKKKTSISASAKSYKASAKTKSYTVTLKTDKGSSIDGKVYMKSGKKVTMKLNGKTYTAKTNSKGQATFKLKITKKGKFASTVKFAGDSTYLASSKSVKITIK